MMFILFMAFGGRRAAGGSGDSFWEPEGALPSEIKLRAASGATGIHAFVPANPFVKFIMDIGSYFGLPFTGSVIESPTEAGIIGVTDNGGSPSASMSYDNLATGESGAVIARTGITKMRYRAAAGGGGDVEIESFQSKIGSEDNATNNSSSVIYSNGASPAIIENIEKAGVPVFGTITDETGTRFVSPGGGVTCFWVEEDGELRTNQIGATAHATPAGQMKIKDITGTEFFVNAFQP